MIYLAHPKYRFLVLACAVLGVLFAWQLRAGFEVGTALFLIIILGLLVWYSQALGSRVVVEPTRLVLHRPLATTRAVEFRQLAGVSEEGRFGQAILVLYHPLGEQGLVVLDEIQSLALPTVRNQDALLAMLVEQIPA
jgi:hypothetical protein